MTAYNELSARAKSKLKSIINYQIKQNGLENFSFKMVGSPNQGRTLHLQYPQGLTEKAANDLKTSLWQTLAINDLQFFSYNDSGQPFIRLADLNEPAIHTYYDHLLKLADHNAQGALYASIAFENHYHPANGQRANGPLQIGNSDDDLDLDTSGLEDYSKGPGGR